MPTGADTPRRFDTYERDEAIGRVRRTTRWVVASAALGTGVLVGVVAHELPARTTLPAGSTGATGTSGATGASGTPSTGASGGSAPAGATTGSAPAGTVPGGATTSGIATTTGSPSISQGTQQAPQAITGQS